MLTKRANDIQQGLTLPESILKKHAAKLKDLTDRRDAILAKMHSDELDIVAHQLPIGDVLGNVIREAENAMKPWQRKSLAVANLPAKWGRHFLGGAFGTLIKLKELFSKKENTEPFRREAVEAAALRNKAETLRDFCRAELPSNLKPSESTCTQTLQAFEAKTAPEPTDQWRVYGAQRAREWVKDHPKKTRALLAARAFGGVFLPFAVTVDLFTSGGTVTLGISTWIAIGGAIGGASAGAIAIGTTLNKAIDYFGMERLVRDFQAEWKVQRNKQLRAHLLDHFLRPLVLNKLDSRIQALNKAPASDCRAAVTHLRHALDELSQPAS